MTERILCSVAGCCLAVSAGIGNWDVMLSSQHLWPPVDCREDFPTVPHLEKFDWRSNGVDVLNSRTEKVVDWKVPLRQG